MSRRQAMPTPEKALEDRELGQGEARASIPGQAGMKFRSFDLFDIRVHAMTADDLLAVISEAVADEKKYLVTNLNMHSLYGLHHYSGMREHHLQANFTHIDGLPLIPLLRLFGIRLKPEHRIPYVEFLPRLAAEASKRWGWRIFYLGSEPGIVEKGAASLRERFPGLQLRTHHGYFDTQGAENEAVLADIRAYAPDVLMVGMGMPRQEIWVSKNLDRIEARTILACCGCTMDYIAGKTAACPRWLGNYGFEWLYRLLVEPARLWRRYLVEPWFVLIQFGSAYIKLGRNFDALGSVIEDRNE